MCISFSATSILNNVFILSSREFKMAVWVANSVAGGAFGNVPEGGWTSSQEAGVDGRPGVVDGVDIEAFPDCWIVERECVPGKGREGSTETGRRITFLNEARKFVLSFSRITLPRIAELKSFASAAI